METGKNYKVIESCVLEDLEERVNNAIDSGWKPAGGMTVRPSGALLQAMYRDQEQIKYSATDETIKRKELDEWCKQKYGNNPPDWKEIAELQADRIPKQI